MSRAGAFVLGALLLTAPPARAQNTPVPQPFPGAGPTSATTSAPPPRTSQPSRPAPAAPAVQTPAPAPPAASRAGAPALPTTIPIYPSAEFIDAFDAGSGQRYYLYGTNVPYADIVAYYRTAMKTGGREIYRNPGMQQFDLGKFQDDTMAYPPSVVVKDYYSENSPGYLFADGTTEKRFRTIIQIVPPGPGK